MNKKCVWTLALGIGFVALISGGVAAEKNPGPVLYAQEVRNGKSITVPVEDVDQIAANFVPKKIKCFSQIVRSLTFSPRYHEIKYLLKEVYLRDQDTFFPSRNRYKKLKEAKKAKSTSEDKKMQSEALFFPKTNWRNKPIPNQFEMQVRFFPEECERIDVKFVNAQISEWLARRSLIMSEADNADTETAKARIELKEASEKYRKSVSEIAPYADMTAHPSDSGSKPTVVPAE